MSTIVQLYGPFPIERSPRWDDTAVLPFVHQNSIRPGGICCPHCGSTEFFGGTSEVLLKKLREIAKSKEAKGIKTTYGAIAKLDPQCAVCEHLWELKLVKANNPLDADFVEWRFMAVSGKFEPIRVLARYFQLKEGNLARDKNGEIIGHVNA